VTPPIRVRRRWEPGFNPREAYPGYRQPTDKPWMYRCSLPTCRDTAPYEPRTAPTQPAALAAGLAHLADHTET
jgi:hypothetical protein